MSLNALYDKALRGRLAKEDGLFLSSLEGDALAELLICAGRLRASFRDNKIDLCSIVNAKSGACPEDCSYCAQSARSRAGAQTYPLAPAEVIARRAQEAKDSGAKRFCVVISGRRAQEAELREISIMIRSIRDIGLLPCATLGMLGGDDLKRLKDSGLERYHHNIETSERFFPEICKSHTYRDKIQTIKTVKAAGLSLCSGGIFGLGETWEDRVDMALALAELGADSVPLNFLIPIKGTALESASPLMPMEALKIISLFRFMLPAKEIRVCGGRAQTLAELHPFVFMAGADGLLTGNYLTTSGTTAESDMRLIDLCGLRPG